MKALIATGRLSPKTGGPLATIGNISKAFTIQGHESKVLALGPEKNLKVPIPGDPTSSIHGVYRSYIPELYTSLRAAEVVVVVGVWHPVFALVSLLAFFVPRSKLILVPTNSLMPWDWDKHRAIKSFFRPILWILAKRFNALVCASSGELSQSWPASAFRLGVTIPHAVRIPSVSEKETRRRPVVTYAGRLEPQKDIELLVATAARLRPDFTLEVCGDGNEEFVAEMRRKAEALDVDIDWVGWLSREEVISRMRTSAAVVVTSKAENFCHTAAEAASVGTPVVIVDRIASASDLVRSPLIEAVPADPDALGAALNTLAAEPPNPSSVRDARLWAIREWSIESYASRWASVLAEVGSAAIASKPIRWSDSK